MAISRFTEKPLSQENTGNPPTVVYHYTAYPEIDGLAVQAFAYAVTAPAIVSPYGLLYRQDIQVDPEGADQWHVIVPYAKAQRVAGSFTLSFDTMGGTVNRKVSIATTNSYKAEGVLGDIPDCKQAIDVQEDGSVNGCDIVIPALKLTATFQHPVGFISGVQIKNLARLTGCKNSAPFIGYDAGEVLFLGATGSEGTDSETTVSYQFACSENLVDQTMGPFTGITKQGWDYVWVKFKDEVSESRAVRQPQYLYVEQVYFGKVFQAFLGFG
jgi:hypothetical protein